VPVLIAAWAYSNYGFAIALPAQRTIEKHPIITKRSAKEATTCKTQEKRLLVQAQDCFSPRHDGSMSHEDILMAFFLEINPCAGVT